MMTKFRKGDRVMVECEVCSPYTSNDGRIRIQVEGEWGDFFAPMSKLRMVTPVIEVGDTVFLPDRALSAVVLAIAEDHLWVSLGNGAYATWWRPNIERADPDPVDAPAEEAA